MILCQEEMELDQVVKVLKLDEVLGLVNPAENLVDRLNLLDVAVDEGNSMRCELCNREIIEGQESIHHLIPKSNNNGNGPMAILHSICHKQIHALFSNKQLAKTYNTISKLKAHKDVERFVKWVNKKPIDFDAKIRIGRKNR
jgi:5-methylcytosine-specific restriction endonuclease McrA